MCQFKTRQGTALLLSALLGCKLLALTAAAVAAEAPAKPLPAPHDAKGHILISREPGESSGIWVPQYGRDNGPHFNAAEVKFKPWAKGLYEARQTHDLEPHARCKPSGGARQFLTPYGVEILEIPALQRVYIFDIGGPHTYREVFMDGRAHPKNLVPGNYGHSIGRWEGDTLVIDSVGYNTEFWFERAGLPHTEAAHVTEYLTRTDMNSLEYRFVLEDAQTYDSPVEGTVNLRWSPNEQLFEYMCQQSNYATDLMVDKEGIAVGKTSPIVP